MLRHCIERCRHVDALLFDQGTVLEAMLDVMELVLLGCARGVDRIHGNPQFVLSCLRFLILPVHLLIPYGQQLGDGWHRNFSAQAQLLYEDLLSGRKRAGGRRSAWRPEPGFSHSVLQKSQRWIWQCFFGNARQSCLYLKPLCATVLLQPLPKAALKCLATSPSARARTSAGMKTLASSRSLRNSLM